jgi:hypothetical protein
MPTPPSLRHASLSSRAAISSKAASRHAHGLLLDAFAAVAETLMEARVQ